MLIKKYYEIVENKLNEFPVECRKNYYDNKKDITIHYKQNNKKKKEIIYSYKNNKISVYKEDNLIQALFYMSFRDREKVGQTILQDLDIDILYDNGVACRKGGIIRNKGLTQGFAEYLANSCTKKEPSTINGYFVDLLISIYGEDIIRYPLLNNPVDFFTDKRFFEIFKFCDQLDIFNTCKINMGLVNDYRDEYIEILNNEEKTTIEEMYKILENTISEYKISIVRLFECIINEYKNCNNSNIEFDVFIEKLENFVSRQEFISAFTYDNEEYSVRENIVQLIDSLKNEKRVAGNKKYIKK